MSTLKYHPTLKCKLVKAKLLTSWQGFSPSCNNSRILGEPRADHNKIVAAIVDTHYLGLMTIAMRHYRSWFPASIVFYRLPHNMLAPLLLVRLHCKLHLWQWTWGCSKSSTTPQQYGYHPNTLIPVCCLLFSYVFFHFHSPLFQHCCSRVVALCICTL